jgi:LEA14-like dessication related protein
MKRTLIIACIFGMGLFLISCAGIPTKPTEANFKTPVISLDTVLVSKYFGYWFYDAKITPLKGKAGNNSSPLIVSLFFNITNPNNYPVKLDGFVFTVSFENIDVNMINVLETQWIPAGKTNQLSVMSTIDIQELLTSLLIASHEKVKAKNTNAWDLVEKWWTEVPNMTVPIGVEKGAATFTADGVQKVIPFAAKYPK